MTHFLGKAVAVTTLLVLSTLGVLSLLDNDDSEPRIIDSAALSKSGIKDLNVEYSENKIYLNVELIAPQTCPELIKALGIHPIVIKSKTYQPSCSKISDSLMRITYTLSVTA